MADAVATNVIFSGNRKYAAKFTCVSDGTGETNVVKIDISTLTISQPPGTAAVTRLSIEEVEWDVQGFTSVRFSFDRTTDQIAQLMSGRGSVSYAHLGNAIDNGTGDTGDLLLTSVGAVSGATYDITVVCRLR